MKEKAKAKLNRQIIDGCWIIITVSPFSEVVQLLGSPPRNQYGLESAADSRLAGIPVHLRDGIPRNSFLDPRQDSRQLVTGAGGMLEERRACDRSFFFWQ